MPPPSSSLPSLWTTAYHHCCKDKIDDRELVNLYFEGNPLSLSSLEQTIEALSDSNSPLNLLNTLQTLLFVTLVAEACIVEEKEQFRQRVTQRVDLLSKVIQESFPLFSTLANLIQYLCGEATAPRSPKLTQGGAAPQSTLYTPNQTGIPHSPFHALQGVYCLLLGRLIGDESLNSAALAVVAWHERTLDHELLPPVALFAKEEHGTPNLHTGSIALLFSLAGYLFNHKQWMRCAEQQLAHLTRSEAGDQGELPALYPALIQWTAAWPVSALPSTEREEVPFQDSQCALIAHTTPDCSATATLVGEGTGMGSFKANGVSVLTFGPHRLNLHEGHGYGLEQEVLSQELLTRGDRTLPHTSHHGNSTSISGTVRVTTENRFDDSKDLHLTVPNFWVKSTQTLHDDKMEITARPLFIGEWGDPNFVFYVNSDCCELEGGRELLPGSLEGYRGGVESLFLKGKKGGILLTSTEGCNEMQVIPLAGGPNYWGAKFMVAYSLPSADQQYSWMISTE